MIGPVRVTLSACPNSSEGGDDADPALPVPNGWYKAVYGDELAIGEVRPLSILGRELAIYRGEDGVAREMDACCPHLGAYLAHGGAFEGNAVVCPFHNWKWDGESGRCLEIF